MEKSLMKSCTVKTRTTNLHKLEWRYIYLNGEKWSSFSQPNMYFSDFSFSLYCGYKKIVPIHRIKKIANISCQLDSTGSWWQFPRFACSGQFWKFIAAKIQPLFFTFTLLGFFYFAPGCARRTNNSSTSASSRVGYDPVPSPAASSKPPVPSFPPPRGPAAPAQHTRRILPVPRPDFEHPGLLFQQNHPQQRQDGAQASGARRKRPTLASAAVAAAAASLASARLTSAAASSLTFPLARGKAAAASNQVCTKIK